MSACQSGLGSQPQGPTFPASSMACSRVAQGQTGKRRRIWGATVSHTYLPTPLCGSVLEFQWEEGCHSAGLVWGLNPGTL